MQFFTSIFLVFVAASVLVRLWLSQRQIKHIQAHFAQVPAAFVERISLQDHQRAADYSCTKLKLGRVMLAWETLWLLLWTIGGGINLIDQWWIRFEYSALVTGIGVIFTLTLISSILDMPFSLYQTFVVEERFGFNKTTLTTWLVDLLKTAMLVAILGLPLLAAILWLMNQAGDNWWVYAWLLWVGFSLTMIWAYPAFIAPLFNKFSRLENLSLQARIEDLLSRCGFHSQGVFVVDGSKRSAHGNAYFTGFGKNKRIVFYDTLLESLSEDEVEAVLAHELGHFKRKHITKSLLLSSAISAAGFAILAWLMRSDFSPVAQARIRSR